MSELLLICVPGVRTTASGGALLSVVVVPRLGDGDGGDTLASYGMATWPHDLGTSPMLTVRLHTAAGADLPPFDLPAQHVGEQAVWDGFFSRIKVTPWAPAAGYAGPVVAPTARHAEDVDGAYVEATKDVGDPATVQREVDKLELEAPPPAPDPKAAVPAFVAPDFHRVIALMRQHPTVLRSLGLVLDLAVPVDRLAACGTSGLVSVGWATHPGNFDTITAPQTAFTWKGSRFHAAATATLRDGMVDLTRVSPKPDPVTGAPTADTEPDWIVTTFDVDAAVARLADTKVALSAARSRTAAAPPAGAVPDPPSKEVDGAAVMPTRRSAGLQLVHRQRGDWFGERFARANRRAARLATGVALDDAADPEVLTADDLALGYRLDVRHGGGAWHSVMQRKARYQVDGVVLGAAVVGGWQHEEAHVPAAAAAKGTGDKVYADGVVVRWEGHRLSLPRPTPDGRTTPGRVVHEMPYDFSWEHVVDDAEPLGLPELRFSEGYQLRLRVADIAGGGLLVGEVAGDTSAAPLTTYARHEPVLPPEVPPPAGLLVASTDAVPGKPTMRVDSELLGPGGAVDRLVVRSDPAAEVPYTAAYPANSERVLLPPAATFTLTEWDDRLSGDDATTWTLARRALAVPRGSAEQRHGRNYTWVPDAGADSASVTFVPAAARRRPAGPVLSRWEDEGSWPDHAPKTVRLLAGEQDQPSSVNWEEPTRADLVLPPGIRGVVELASAVDSVYFGRFAAAAAAPIGSTAQKAVTTGRHPVVTPATRIEVVHAVRRPLGKPAGDLKVTRDPGGLEATIGDNAGALLGIDPDSTQQVDVSATWDEWTDAPAPTRTTQALGSLTIDLDATSLPSLVHRFGDTRHRLVTYRLAARSRFRAFFGPDEPEPAFVNEAPLAAVHLPSTERPVAPAVLAVTPASVLSTTAGDGQHVVSRRGGLLRVELAAPWFTTGAGEQLGVVVSPTPGIEPEHEAAVEDADGPTATAAGPHADLVSTVHRDPVLRAAAPTQLTVASITTAAGSPLVVKDVESTSPVCVVPVDVFWAEGRWFADVGIGNLGDDAERSMVRLHLVRFQRHSLRGLVASSIVTCDLVRLLPDRLLSVTTSPAAGITVTLSVPAGSVARSSLTQFEARLEAAPVATAADGLTGLGSGVPGWTVVSRDQTVLGQALTLGSAPSGQSLRVVVREYDDLATAQAPGSGSLEAEHARWSPFVAVVPL